MDSIGFPLVKVVWFDAESTDDWEDIIGIDRSLRPIISVGHMIEEHEDRIVIAMSIDNYNEKCSMVKTIPMFWIEDLDFLKVVR
jgi:hypothetical protein